MISESSYWKDTLAKHAEFINLKLRQRRWTDASFGRLEEAVIMSCFIVRKLNESAKIDPRHCAKTIKLIRYGATGENVTALNSHRLTDLYEANNGSDVEKSLYFVLNQLIHSFVLIPVFDAVNSIKAYAFNSDKTKSKEVFLVELSELAERFANVAGSYLSGLTIFNVGIDGDLSIVPHEKSLD